MAPRSSALRLVDPETGEITAAPEIQDLQDTIDGLQSTIRSQSGIIGALKRDLKPEEGHDLFPMAKRLHDYYKFRCRHPHHKFAGPIEQCPRCKRIKFGVERFKEILPRLNEHKDEAEALCLRAIDGAAYDCFTTTRKNGSVKYHNGWELIFRADKFEEMCNRAPYHKPKPEHLSIICKALLWQHPSWENERVMAEAKKRVRRWAT